MTDPHDQEFRDAWLEHRAYVVDLAFRMLGNIQDAEDVVQDAFGRLQQRAQRCAQIGRPSEQLVNHDFVIACGQHPPQLASAPIALLRKVAFGGAGGFLSAGHAGQVDIQNLPVLLVLVGIAPRMLAVDGLQRLHAARV